MKIVHTAFALAALLAAGAGRAGELVSVDEAKGLVGKPGVRFVFAGSDQDFQKGHIPGSVSAYAHDLHLLDDIRACKGLPMCEPRAAKVIGEQLGLDAAAKVVVYDVGHGVDASGDWFFLTLYGVKDVHILDGGLATWKAHGGAVEAGPPAKVAAKPFTPAVQWNMIASIDEVKKATGDSAHYLVLDARHTLDEYTGKTLQSALAAPGKEEAVMRGGAIPSAVFSPFTKYAGNKGAEADKPTFKDDAELKKQVQKLEKNGYAAGKTVISYCHVGLGRGSFQYLALRRAGVQNVKVYVGSWDEWGNTASMPLAAQP
ncbi:MAG TPA: rhodanese-like domain-containing protein [Anaeromyxobacteraceae bacterium]|nr:rhodanese-like domain-containing protein [Anaeromyxobacteraceae bacterium]